MSGVMDEFDRTYAKRFTTEGLEETIAHGDLGTVGGLHPRQAAPLLRLDTPARRERAYHEASTRQNLSGGVLSARLSGAVGDLLRMIAAGNEDQEMYAEGAARHHREAERKANEGNLGQRIIIYPPEMRRN